MLTLEEYEKLVPACHVAHDGVDVSYFTPNSFLKWRVDSLFSKEPCTIEWIAGFQRGEILVDVGANVACTRCGRRRRAACASTRSSPRRRTTASSTRT